MQRAVVTKFDDCLSLEVAESSRRSNYVQASKDIISKLVEVRHPCQKHISFLPSLFIQVVCFAFSGNAAARGYFNRMEEVASFAVEVKKWKEADKAAFEKAKKAEESSAKADDARRKVEEARKKAEDDLSIARSEHFRYFQEVLNTILN